MKKELKELLTELKANRNINRVKNLENTVDINYMIERIESILKEG